MLPKQCPKKRVKTTSITESFAINMEFGVQKFPNRKGALDTNLKIKSQFNYGLFQMGTKLQLGDFLYLKLLAGASGANTKRLGPLVTFETGFIF